MLLVRYFAGARAAAGCAEEKVDAATIAEVVMTVSERHGARLEAVLGASSFLVDEVVCHDRSRVLSSGATIDVLPPFAGG